MVISFPIKPPPPKRDIAIPFLLSYFHMYFSRSALQFATTICFLLQLLLQYSISNFSFDLIILSYNFVLSHPFNTIQIFVFDIWSK